MNLALFGRAFLLATGMILLALGVVFLVSIMPNWLLFTLYGVVFFASVVAVVYIAMGLREDE